MSAERRGLDVAGILPEIFFAMFGAPAAGNAPPIGRDRNKFPSFTAAGQGPVGPR
jgi:hypothetical protein